MKKRILIIEDEATMRKSLEEVLEENGYEVEEAMDGEKGLEMAVNNQLDLIMLDIILPKKNGFEVLEAINEKRKEKKFPPIILLTNLNEVDDVQKALDLGATNYLVKANYQLSDIVKKIQDVLEKENNE